MENTISIDQICVQYDTLCHYCDEVFETTSAALKAHMQCGKGCASCCILETVNPLEAYMLERFLEEHPIPAFQNSEDTCVFLQENLCSIYPVRPIICRTHGLPLLYPERGDIEVCPLNFTDFDLGTLESTSFLDAERLTDNLMRLNLAFCMLTGQPDRADERIDLKSILFSVKREA
jgi:hypothetical protein